MLSRLGRHDSIAASLLSEEEYDDYIAEMPSDMKMTAYSLYGGMSFPSVSIYHQ